MKKCPICGEEYEHAALSRKDNKTEICPLCGCREALEAAHIRKDTQAQILDMIRKEGEKH